MSIEEAIHQRLHVLEQKINEKEANIYRLKEELMALHNQHEGLRMMYEYAVSLHKETKQEHTDTGG